MTTPASARIDDVMNAMPGVGSGPTSMTSAPAVTIPACSALSSMYPDSRVSLPMTMRPGRDGWRKRCATAWPSRSATSAVMGSWFATPRMPSVPNSRLPLSAMAVSRSLSTIGRTALYTTALRAGRRRQGLGDPHDVAHGAHVVDAHGGRAAEDRRRDGRRRPELTLARGLAREVPDEGLARHPHHERRAEPRPEAAQPAQQRQVVLEHLAEADAGVGPDLAAAGRARRLELRAELLAHLAHDVLEGHVVHHLRRPPAQVAEHDLRARGGRHLEDGRIEQRARDVVDDARPRGERDARSLGLVSVDRDEHVLAQAGPQALDDGNDARALFVPAHGLRARPRRLTPDVDPVGALPGHAYAGLDGLLHGREVAAVREGVRRAIEHADYQAAIGKHRGTRSLGPRLFR